MPRAPLLAGAVAARRLGGSAVSSCRKSNPTVIPTGCHRTGCGSQRSFHFVHALLAAAPTTPPCFRHWRRSSLLPSRGGLGKEVEPYAMPRAPLLAGAVAAGDWGVHRQQLLKSNPTVIPTGCHRTGCGSQRSFHFVHALLAAAPTTPPCFRHWRRSSLLPSRGGLGKEGELYAMPRAPLLVGAVAAGDWGVHRQQLLHHTTQKSPAGYWQGIFCCI